MKYTINYILSGGSTSPESTSIEDLPIAFSIYEFKSSIGLVPKAIEQNIKNIDRCKTGAYKKGDKSETFKFKTNYETKKVIFINDKNNTQFNGLFMESKHVHRSIDDLIANKKIDNIKNMINKHLDLCYKICTNERYNIYVLDKDNEIRTISESLLWKKFTDYKDTLDTHDIREFLLDNLKKEPEKEIYINDFLLLIDLEKQITGNKFRILQDLASQVGVSFRNKKLYPYIILKEYELDEPQLEKFERITDSLNNIKAPDGRSIIEIYDMLDEKKRQSGATGHQIGNEFENLIEETLDLQENLVRTVDKLEPGSYTTYFNYTNITSDIDMTVVKK